MLGGSCPGIWVHHADCRSGQRVANPLPHIVLKPQLRRSQILCWEKKKRLTQEIRPEKSQQRFGQAVLCLSSSWNDSPSSRGAHTVTAVCAPRGAHGPMRYHGTAVALENSFLKLLLKKRPLHPFVSDLIGILLQQSPLAFF